MTAYPDEMVMVFVLYSAFSAQRYGGNVMRRLIVVAGLVLAILAGSLSDSREAAAAGATYSCTATGPGLAVAASGLTKEQAQAFQESYEAQGASVECKKKPSATAVSS
jgi:hypothetical protein